MLLWCPEQNFGLSSEDMKCLNSFDRFYNPTSIYRHQGIITGHHEYESFIGRSIKPSESLHGVSPIIGGIFCFEAPKTDTVKQWIIETKTEPNFLFIFALNEWIATCDPKNRTWRFAPIGQDAFASFAYLFTGFFNKINERELHLSVDSDRYFEFAAKNIPKFD